MSTSNRPITAREYKLMLNVDRFADRAHGSEAFYHLLKFLIEKDGEATIQAESEEKRRLTSYWDTSELALRQEGYALRLRQKKKGFEINLKHRSPDRYLSAARALANSQNGETKFEEDILPPFVSKFALSTEVDVTDAPDLSTVQKAVALFPGLAALNFGCGRPLEADQRLRGGGGGPRPLHFPVWGCHGGRRQLELLVSAGERGCVADGGRVFLRFQGC